MKSDNLRAAVVDEGALIVPLVEADNEALPLLCVDAHALGEKEDWSSTSDQAAFALEPHPLDTDGVASSLHPITIYASPFPESRHPPKASPFELALLRIHACPQLPSGDGKDGEIGRRGAWGAR